MRKRVARYLIVNGLILTPIFLIIFGNLVGRKNRMEEREAQVYRYGTPGFATLEKGHIQKGAFATHYYFTYQLLSDAFHYRTTEEVTTEYFHTHTEGRNVEALIYIDDGDLAHTHLRGNRMVGFDGLRGIMKVSLYGWILSALMLLVGILISWPGRSQRLSATLSGDENQPHLN